jgi:parallel beta-helix repeat protein
MNADIMNKRKFFNYLITAVTGLCCLASSSPAASITVPSVKCRTIAEAMAAAQENDTIWLLGGTYNEHVLMSPGITLAARVRDSAVLNGGGIGKVVEMSKNNTLQGLEVRNGTIGVFSRGRNNAIQRCRIVKNRETGIMCVRFVPAITDNIIANNGGAGIEGWDARSTVASIDHNTIAYNANGIGVGGASSVVIENNIIAFNTRCGILIRRGADNKVTAVRNDLFANKTEAPGLRKNNYEFDPAFRDPVVGMDFSIVTGRCCPEHDDKGQNLGAR